MASTADSDGDGGTSHLWIIGVVINVIGSLSINLSTNCIKLAHTRLKKASKPGVSLPKLVKNPVAWFNVPYNANRIWLASMVVFIVANVANFISFSFAAQSLLAALGSIQFVSNVIFAKFVNREPLNAWILSGTCIVVVGCILLVVFGSHSSPTYDAQQLLSLYSNPAYIAYLSITAVLCVLAFLVYRIGKRRCAHSEDGIPNSWNRWLPICYTIFSACIGTQSVLFGKSMSLLLRTTLAGNSQVGQWYTWIVVVAFLGCAFFWVRQFNNGLKLFPVSIIMPTLQVGWILLTMASGSIYFQEINDMNTIQKVMFGVGTAILLSGVYVITTSSSIVQSDAVPVESKVSLIASGVYCMPAKDPEDEYAKRRHTVHLLASLSSTEEEESQFHTHSTMINASHCKRRHTVI
jgi:drug/metabolite transporter superfamily protein YnfA